MREEFELDAQLNNVRGPATADRCKPENVVETEG